MKVCVDTKKYQRVLRIENKNETQTDALNNPVEQWDTYCDCKGWGVPLRGREYFQGDQTQATVTHRYRVPFSKLTEAVTTKMRMIDRTNRADKTLNIIKVVNVENANREMEIDCVEAV